MAAMQILVLSLPGLHGVTISGQMAWVRMAWWVAAWLAEVMVWSGPAMTIMVRAVKMTAFIPQLPAKRR